MYLVTGGAGFIGSHIVERLLKDRQKVRVLDNFSTGRREFLDFKTPGAQLEVVEGDIVDPQTVLKTVNDVQVIFHQAAQRSVPRSVDDPLGANENNVTGTLNILVAAQKARVKRVVYASSSSAYGDRPDLPKREDQTPAPISPYAVSKLTAEYYCSVWSRLYGVETVSLRYFNVFGPRQDPASQYAAVIPRFILSALERTPLEVHGDGLQSRDFTYIDNVVDVNLLASRVDGVSGEVYNIGCGSRTSLMEIIRLIEAQLGYSLKATHTPPRSGDVRHTLADISKAKRMLSYLPTVAFAEGLRRTVEFFTTQYVKR
jgi:nucleoside-diphosphate-sugar epimerase